MSIFDFMKQQKRNERDEQIVAYYRFLASIDISETSEAEAKRLSGYLDALDKRIEDAEKDHAQIVEAKRHLRLIEDNADANEAYTDAQNAFLAVCKRRQDSTREMNEAVRLAQNVRDAEQGRTYNKQFSQSAVAKLKEDEPLLYVAVTTSKEQKKRASSI